MRPNNRLRIELEQHRLISEITDMRDPPSVVKGRKGLRGFTRERAGFREIEVVARKGQGVPIRCLIVAASERRPKDLPSEIPFIPGLGSRCEIGPWAGEPTISVLWPFPLPSRPDLKDLLSDVWPPPHTSLNHPRRFSAVVTELLGHFHRELPDDERTRELADIARLAESRVRPVGDPIEEDEWMSKAHMDAFEYACETAGMTEDTLRRLEMGFDQICKSLEQAGWERSEPEWQRWSPLPARNWIDCFKGEGDSINLLRWPTSTGVRSLQFLREPEGLHDRMFSQGGPRAV